jgi:hypothetical protein
MYLATYRYLQYISLERYLSLDYTEDGTTIEKKQQLMNLSN